MKKMIHSQFITLMQKSIVDEQYGFCELKTLAGGAYKKTAYYQSKQDKKLLVTQASTWNEVYEILNQRLEINGYKKNTNKLVLQ